MILITGTRVLKIRALIGIQYQHLFGDPKKNKQQETEIICKKVRRNEGRSGALKCTNSYHDVVIVYSIHLDILRNFIYLDCKRRMLLNSLFWFHGPAMEEYQQMG